MMQTLKKFLAAVLALTVMLSVGLVPALADDDTDEALELIATDLTLTEDGETFTIEVVPAEEGDLPPAEEAEALPPEEEDDASAEELPAEVEFEDTDAEPVEIVDSGAVAVIYSPIDTDGTVYYESTPLNSEEYPDVSKINNTFAQAAEEVRGQMKNRKAELSTSFKSDSLLMPQTGNEEEDTRAFSNLFLEEVFRHTGVPTEGDYLRWQLDSYSFRAKIYVSSKGDTYYYILSYEVKYYDTAEQESAVDAAVKNIIDGLGLNSEGSCTDYEKIFRIYNYITKSVNYGAGENLSGYSAYGALVNNLATCQGFTLAIYRLALEAGLDARIVPNTLADHAWNIVRVGDSYYNLDATWEKNATWSCFLCGDAGHTAGQTVTNGDYSFRDRHLADTGDFSSYYRPDWVSSEYTIPMTDYPCFADAAHPNGTYLTQIDPKTNAVSACERGENGKCKHCGQLMQEEELVSGTVKVETGTNLVAYADGVEVEVAEDGSIELTNRTKVLTTFTFNTTDATTNYPEQQSMKVYFISVDGEGKLVAEHDESFDAIMQYMGASVRCSGKKGIRIITGIPRDRLTKLKGSGLNGWKLVEYGTVVGNSEYIDSAVTFGAPKSGSATFNANPFQKYGDCDGYTVGLIFDDMEQCKVTFSMRPYMKISNGEQTVVIYGGAVLRSIGYVAWQNRNAFDPAKQPSNYKFIREIMEYCGYKADEEQQTEQQTED